MERSRRKEIEHHLTEEEIDELLREAEDDHHVRRLGFLKNLYHGDSIPEAADREGRSAATGGRWADAWNEDGLEGLMPSFGGGRPPKLDEDEQDELVEMLRDGQPWKSQEIHHLLQEEFDVSYSPNYLGTFLRNLGLSYAKPRPKRHIDQRTPMKSSKSASMTRSTRANSHITNMMEKTTKGGLLTTTSALMVVPFSDFLTHRSHSRTIIHDVSGT